MTVSVIVLNASYERHQVVSVPHAIRMLVRKVAVLEEGDLEKLIGPYPWPKVLRLVRYVYMKWKRGPALCFSAAAMFKRDGHTCAYCGKYGNTIDHILPESRGGPTSWMNCITACESCNWEKADRTPREAGMRLLFHPCVPENMALVSASVI